MASTRLIPTEDRKVIVRWSSTKGRPELRELPEGDVYILNLPGKPFLAYQLHAQELMPNSFVAAAGYGDISTGYVPTAQAGSQCGYGAKSPIGKTPVCLIRKSGSGRVPIMAHGFSQGSARVTRPGRKIIRTHAQPGTVCSP